MAPNADPWRTLGLSPGATQDEIRRAYRRLAKVNHPDAAGEGALPRFLAIQQAYDQLAGPGRVRRAGARPAPHSQPAAEAREPWRADPGRAGASGRADGRRAPGARPGGSGAAAPGGPSGSTADPAKGRAGSAGTGGAGEPGPRADREAGAARGAGDAGSAGAAGGTGADAGRSRRASGRRRASNRATPGSTSYEGADEEPFEPGWSGATWYGASSGTYWTINPKEYADPRKHGPEYQARARRATGVGRIPEGAAAPDLAGDPPGLADDGADRGDADPTRRPPRRDRPDGSRPSWTSAAARDGAAGPPAHDRTTRAGAHETGPAAGPAPGPTAGPARRPGDGRPGATPPPGWASSAGGVAAPPRPPPFPNIRDLVDEPSTGRFRAPVLREPTTPIGRLAMALVGWPPLGIFVAAAIDDSTGCGRYAASCSEISSPGTWIVNAVIVLLLLALPRLATWSAHGAIVALVAGVPSAIALSAGGGSNVPEASGPVLLAVLVIAYLVGVAYAVVRPFQLGTGRAAAERRVP